jgi:hypothetical protein
LLTFPKDMRAIAKKYSLDFNVNFGQATEGKPNEPGYINFQMSIKGPFDKVTQFLNEVDQSPYFLEYISMETNWETTGVSINISGRVFSR